MQKCTKNLTFINTDNVISPSPHISKIRIKFKDWNKP